MAQENELQTLREELQKIQDQTRRSRRRAAVGFVILVLALVLSMLYGFIQRVEATRQAEEAFRQRILAEASARQAAENAEEARRQEMMATQQRAAAEARVQELEKCCKKR